MAAIVGRDKRYQVCGAAPTFAEANKLVRQHRPDVLLIEPFSKTAIPAAGSKISRRNSRVFASLSYHGNPNGFMRSAPFVPEHRVTG